MDRRRSVNRQSLRGSLALPNSTVMDAAPANPSPGDPSGSNVQSTSARPRESKLAKHTREQLIALYLRYDGVTIDKIPNLVAELNLSIPVDFDVEKYFTVPPTVQPQVASDASPSTTAFMPQKPAAAPSSAAARRMSVAAPQVTTPVGGAGALQQPTAPPPASARRLSTTPPPPPAIPTGDSTAASRQLQLILQPEDLCRFVEDLQDAMGNPLNNGVSDTCQLLALGLPPSVSPSSELGTERSQGQSTYLHRSQSLNRSGLFGSDAEGLSGGSRPRDFIDRAVVEATLERFFPSSSDATRMATATVFQPASDVGGAGGSRRPTLTALTAGPRSAGQAQRQSLDQFRSFLQSHLDDPRYQQLEDAFRRCGAVDEGYGLVLPLASLQATCENHRLEHLLHDIVVALDTHKMGEVESSVFDAVAMEQLILAGKRAAALTASPAAAQSSQASSATAAAAGSATSTTSAGAAGSAAQGMLANASPASATTTNGGGKSAASSFEDHALPKSGSTGAPTSGGAAAITQLSAALNPHLHTQVGSANLTPPPVAVLIAVVAPQAVITIAGRRALSWLLQMRHVKPLTSSGTSHQPGAGFSLAAGGTAAVDKSKRLLGTSSASHNNNGGGTPNTAGAALDGQATRRPVNDDDMERLLSGVDDAGRGKKSHRRVALPRYMHRKADDEFSHAVKQRVSERKRLDQERAQSARMDRHTVALRLGRLHLGAPLHRTSLVHLHHLSSPSRHDRLDDDLDIDAVLQSKPPSVPKPPPLQGEESPRVGDDNRNIPSSARLSQPKGYALLRQKRKEHEAVSSGGSLAEKFLINYDKDTPRGRDVTPIIENALHNPYVDGPPPHKMSPRAAALLADPYAHPAPRLHSAKDVRYVYHNKVDSWRVSPRRVTSASSEL